MLLIFVITPGQKQNQKGNAIRIVFIFHLFRFDT